MSVSKSRHSRVADHIGRLPKSGIRDFFELVNTMDDVVSLGIGEPDFVTPWHIREATIYALDKGHTSYTSNLGLLSLRKALCHNAANLFGVSYDPDTECIVTVGVSEALDLLLRAILNPGEEVIYHEPCYVSYAPSIAMAHAQPVPVVTREKNAFALDPAEVEAAVTPRTKAILLNFPNNPTGADLTLEQKTELARIAVENDLIVIADEIYTELSYGERTRSLVALPGMRERTVLLHGFSKAYAMTGFRLGYACGPHELIDAMMKVHQYTMLCASIIAQEAGLEALANGREPMIAMREEYRQRRNVIVKRLNELGLRCHLPRGAFYVFPRIADTGLSSEEFARRLLADQNVAVVPGTAFGASGEGFVRCSYAASLEEIELAMSRIGRFLDSIGYQPAD